MQDRYGRSLCRGRRQIANVGVDVVIGQIGQRGDRGVWVGSADVSLRSDVHVADRRGYLGDCTQKKTCSNDSNDSEVGLCKRVVSPGSRPFTTRVRSSTVASNDSANAALPTLGLSCGPGRKWTSGLIYFEVSTREYQTALAFSFFETSRAQLPCSRIAVHR